ncbi:retrotransposon protein, putative, ty1-copia subclass [Tanacetum coccineum]
MLAWLVLQGLRRSKKLKHGALSLYMGNRMRATVEAIESFDLILPSGLIIVLDNCHFAPTVTRGVVLISRLVKNDYIHTFTKLSNKRAKHGLDSYYLWHCRLGHINKKRIDMLQRDRLLQPTHDESHEKCKSSIFGKMAWKPFPHQVERAKDLLELIHTDVCGSFRTVSRKGANYFITFTDDFSCYGFVYLMKHKHEVFENFKVFQNEVKNQLGKKIKAIRSDKGGEYLSHEVSERRNQTLLDMVQSMMNLTTLPKSFWGYALETAARILNMVPTKKVDRTSYEIWHRKAPKLSYLRVWGCEALVKRDTPDKLDSRSIKCIFVGYPKETMGYYFFYPLENKIFVSRNAKFFENSFTYKKRNLITPNYKAALADPESNKWLEAMNTEMQSMKDNQVWILVELHPNGRTIRSKWLFKKKTDMDGNNKRFDEEIKKIGFTQNPDGPCVYHKASESNVAFLVLYVDDILLMGNSVAMLQEVKSWFFVFSKILVKFTGLLYFRNTKDMVLVYGDKPEDELKVSCYADASFQTDKDDTKSQTGYVFVLNGEAVDWKSAKKSTTAMSSTEVEYIAAAEALMEAVWMRKFINGLGGVMPSNKRPIKMLCDNEPTLAIAGDPRILKGARHFQRKYHYIREVIQRGEIVLKKVHTYDNVANFFTKPVPFNKHFEHAMGIGIVHASSLM